MKNIVQLLLLFVFLCFSHSSAISLMNLTQWKIEDGGNDHWYAVNITRHIWQDGENDANGLSIDGFSGNLTSITTQEENDFIFNFVAVGIDDPLYTGQDQFLLGGFWSNENWSWSTGEPFLYTNWSAGEPNHLNETAISLWGEDSRISSGRYPGYWNDTRSNFGLFSIVEWGDPLSSNPNPVSNNDPIPEPTTILLFCIGLVGIVIKKSIG